MQKLRLTYWRFSLETLPLPTPAAALSVQLSIMTVKLQPNGVCAAALWPPSVCVRHEFSPQFVFCGVALLGALRGHLEQCLWSGLSPCSWGRSRVKFPKQPLPLTWEKWYQKLTPYGSAWWLKQVRKDCYYRKPVDINLGVRVIILNYFPNHCLKWLLENSQVVSSYSRRRLRVDVCFFPPLHMLFLSVKPTVVTTPIITLLPNGWHDQTQYLLLSE